ncbi:DUF6975 family protein [Sphingomonas oligophenolica]|uniref:Uncharacterized protein n=1 Tax=Sphingomonas oligophenolica TaxID=301154 RepID=A0A502CIS3_9SPHN|nr:hypothetical protein [Sphingomonas oligophenolica]TPG12713.1 hypothetical protein EAH84_08005 [Sphingomonas oligophenolica]
MVSDIARAGWQDGAWGLVTRLGDADGSATHRYLSHLIGGDAAARDLSDAVHALCAVHGHQPGIADEALTHGVQPEAADWLDAVASGFVAERAYLATLTAAVGPAPSTPAQAASEAAMIGQRHTLDTLARSGRRGCATGAVAALVTDWRSIRGVLDRAARRFGADVAPDSLPLDAETATWVGMLGGTPGVERAISFGAQQLFAQHRGLFDLLEARASARDA